MNTPFTLEDAEEIAEDFEDLIDTSFKTKDGISFSIDNVLVCPFEEIEKQQFALRYHTTKDKSAALSLYEGTEYDVVVFTYSGTSEPGYTIFDIRAFAEIRGIKYNFG